MIKKVLIVVSVCFLLYVSINMSTLVNSNVATILFNNLKKGITTLNNEISNQKGHMLVVTPRDKSKDELIETVQNQVDIKGKIDNERMREKLTIQIEELELLAKVDEIIYTDEWGNQLPMTNPNTIKWFGFKEKQVTIYLTEKSLQKFGFLIGKSDAILLDIAKYFGVPSLPNRIPVFICFDEPIKISGFGEYKSKEKKVLMRGASVSPYNHTTNTSIVSLFVHELTHAFQDQVMNLNHIRTVRNSSLYWIAEGMGEFVQRHYINYQKYDIPTQHLNMRHKSNQNEYTKLIKRNLKLNGITVNQITNLPSEMMKNYETYESIYYYIETVYGHAVTMRFIEDLENLTINESCIKNFKVSEKALIEGWKRYFYLNE
jgi:hypothetical protein